MTTADGEAMHPNVDWQPPDNPDPHAILREAHADAHTGRHADALAKHLWFYENALAIEPSLYGVRLSFALGYWHELGQMYPTALTALLKMRERADAQCRADQFNRESFHDFTAISDTLRDDDTIVSLFQWLDSQRPTAAREVHDIAHPALVRKAEYQLLSKYVDPESWFERMMHLYRENLRLAARPEFGEELQDFARKGLTNEAATLVGLLVISDRSQEAKTYAEKLHSERDDEEFRVALEKALSGQVPTPWPERG